MPHQNVTSAYGRRLEEVADKAKAIASGMIGDIILQKKLTNWGQVKPA